MTQQRKAGAQIFTADGAGGMREVTDHRFNDDPWPIVFRIASEQAKDWMAHLEAEIEERGWSSSGIGQLHAEENSGSRSVSAAAGQSPPALAIAWEKKRGKELFVRAKPDGTPALPLDEARAFLDAVNARLRNRKMTRQQRREILRYQGRPWRGELWLDPDHRLGPPSQFPPELLGQQAVILDVMVEGIGSSGVSGRFMQTLSELSVFVGVVLGLHFEPQQFAQGWVYETDERMQVTKSYLGKLGYVELSPINGFPPVGSSPPITRHKIARPGLGDLVLRGTAPELWVPDDIELLWKIFLDLPDEKREQFLQAANAYRVALSLWRGQRTAYAAFLVVACEALKPRHRRFHRTNIYDVVESLAGTGAGLHLRKLSFAPQRVRSDLFHRGDLLDGELGPLLMSETFDDPSFDEMLWTLSDVSRVCLIQWLLQRGTYKVVHLPRQPLHSGWRSWTFVRQLRDFLSA